MLILVDGVDLTGKSTLIRRLAALSHPPALVQHNAGPPTTGSSVLEYLQPLHAAAAGVDVIVDRSFVSEYVWPNVFRRDSDMDEELFWTIARRADAMGAVHVHAFRDPTLLERELVEAREPVYHLDFATASYAAAYEKLATAGHLVLPWDYEAMGDEDVDFIRSAAHDHYGRKVLLVPSD